MLVMANLCWSWAPRATTPKSWLVVPLNSLSAQAVDWAAAHAGPVTRTNNANTTFLMIRVPCSGLFRESERPSPCSGPAPARVGRTVPQPMRKDSNETAQNNEGGISVAVVPGGGLWQGGVREATWRTCHDWGRRDPGQGGADWGTGTPA